MSISIPGADFTPQLAGYTGQGAFRFWCQKVLPIVYDDSLSYYELLNKVVVYLNNVISDVATVEDNVGALNEAYASLQEFVNTQFGNVSEEVNTFETAVQNKIQEFTDFLNEYFDNLDVQNEINNKLDEMASDGTLSALIGPIVVRDTPGIVTDWLAQHITPTSPAIDSSLTISGAGADSKAVGDALKAIVASQYSENSEYEVGAYCLYENKLYRCKRNIVAGEAWDVTHWELVSLTDSIDELKDVLYTEPTAIWELGTASTVNGELSDSTTNIRTDLVKCNAGSEFNADSGYYLIVMKYDPVTEVYVGTDVGWTHTYTTDGTYAIRVLAKTQNGDVIADVSSVSEHIHLNYKTDDRITELSDVLFGYTTAEWELGTASTINGELSDSATNIRTDLVKCNAGSEFNADSGYYLIVMKYDPDTEEYVGTDVGWTHTYTTDGTYAIRVLAKIQDGSVISNVSSVSSHIHLDYKTDDRITELSGILFGHEKVNWEFGTASTITGDVSASTTNVRTNLVPCGKGSKFTADFGYYFMAMKYNPYNGKYIGTDVGWTHKYTTDGTYAIRLLAKTQNGDTIENVSDVSSHIHADYVDTDRITDLEAGLSDLLYDDVTAIWELGTASTANGTLSDSNTNIRTNLVICNGGSNFTADYGYYLMVMKYDADTEMYIETDVGWNISYTTDGRYAVRVLAKTQNGDIISDVSSVSTHIHLNYVIDDRITALERKVDDLESKPLRFYTQENLDVSRFTASAGNSDWYWTNNVAYPAGYIDHFVIYGTDQSIGNTAYVAVYDKTLGKFVWHSEGVLATQKKVVIPCHAYFEHEIYVLTRLKYIAHNSVGNTVKYALMWEFGVWAEGAVFDIDWKPSDVLYKFAVECWYDDYVDLDTLHYAKANNRMFIAGDSITAGYPYTQGISRPNYYDPDIKWGEQVARKLGFDVTYGAQTGSGWLYRTEPSAQYAISIADNNNFINYDTAVFAFGTNDYGNNSPLGDIDDSYPGDNTVCGAINYVINKVFSDNPKITLIISTPINRSDVGNAGSNYGYGTKNTANYTLMELVEKMKELCLANGVCIIDNSNTPFNKYTLDNLLMDHLHPNPDGYKILGALMAERISLFITPYTRNVLTAE